MTPIRCVCHRRTLLASFGVDVKGEPVVHVRSWRNNKIHVDVIVTSGVVRVLCRDCGRYYVIKMVKGEPKLSPAIMDNFGEMLEAPHPARR